ncbi:MAG: hypothetical protein HZA52_16725 [Planctomycetes bacterium]|nr:hypothetical protein [Planctomycetota bacterium]
MSRSKQLLLDSNLLLLYVVGAADPKLLPKHKRTAAFEFTPADLELLLELMSRFDEWITTPNILTEVSNLSRHGVAGDRMARVSDELTRFSAFGVEHYVETRRAADDACFRRLGLTDAGICVLSETGVSVVTLDAMLADELARRGVDVLNFHHVRSLS